MKCAPETGPKIVMITTRMAPVVIVLPSKAIAWFPPARRSAMMPEPITVATRMAVPSPFGEEASMAAPTRSHAPRRCDAPMLRKRRSAA